MDNVKILRNRIEFRLNDCNALLASKLKYAKAAIEAAQKALEAGQPIDEHLIANMMGMTTAIVSRNVALELAPYTLDDAPKPKKH